MMSLVRFFSWSLFLFGLVCASALIALPRISESWVRYIGDAWYHQYIAFGYTPLIAGILLLSILYSEVQVTECADPKEESEREGAK